MWKGAIIIPVPKSQNATCEDEVRPISLTACLSKILEDFVVKWMMEDVKCKIDLKQFGSLQGSSITFCLIDMINNWLSSLAAKSRYLRVCVVDFSKASENLSFPGFAAFFPTATKLLKLMVFCPNGFP